jgi:hypothetical protein
MHDVLFMDGCMIDFSCNVCFSISLIGKRYEFGCEVNN